jgi:hypothetical protein
MLCQSTAIDYIFLLRENWKNFKTKQQWFWKSYERSLTFCGIVSPKNITSGLCLECFMSNYRREGKEEGFTIGFLRFSSKQVGQSGT